MTKNDPYNDVKVYHRARFVNSRGGVSPLCAKTPKALNLKRELWTNRDEAVTCPKCLLLIKEHPSADAVAAPPATSNA